MHAPREGVVQPETVEVGLAGDKSISIIGGGMTADPASAEDARHDTIRTDATAESIAVVRSGAEPNDDAQVASVPIIAPADVVLPKPRPKIKMSGNGGSAGLPADPTGCAEADDCRADAVRRVASLRQSP